METIDECECAGMDVIIIDSLSHEWKGDGGILEFTHRWWVIASLTGVS